MRAAVNLARSVWQHGWCPPEADLSWLRGMERRITGASRSVTTVRLAIRHDKGTVPMASGNWWQALSIAGVCAATSERIVNATTVTLTFPATVPANAQLEHCGGAAFYAGYVLRDNWPSVTPAAWADVPGRIEFHALLQRNYAPIVIP